MFFTPSDTKERHAFIEATLSEAYNTLELPAVAARIGELATLFTLVLDRMYVPNFRRSSVSIPESYRDSIHIPIIGFRPDEKIKIDSTARVLTPTQRHLISMKAEEWRPLNDHRRQPILLLQI